MGTSPRVRDLHQDPRDKLLRVDPLVLWQKLGFASAAIASHGYSRILDVDVGVRVGGLPIRPGDVLHADANANGVATIPREVVPEVALACPERARAELNR